MSGVFPDSGVPPTDANNSLPDPDTVNCPDELWYSTSRCTPRFDPAAANAMLSEILNLVNCSGTVYDCSKLDNLCTAVKDLIFDQLFSCMPDRFVNINATCSNEFVILQRDASGCVRFARTDDLCKILDDHLFGCLNRNFPDAGAACKVESLVLTTNAAGCREIARYTGTSSRLGFADNSSTGGPPGYTKQVPATPSNPATFYNRNELYLDAVAGTVDYAGKLNQNLLWDETFTVPCDNTAVSFEIANNVIFNPITALGPSVVSVTYELDGEFPLSHTLQSVTVLGKASNYDVGLDGGTTRTLSAGTHRIRGFAVQESVSKPPAQLGFGIAPAANGGWVSVTVALS